MNVLSLFDGISCGRLALKKAGIKVDKYYASEVDKYAIQTTQDNYPDTIQVGDIQEWKKWKLPKIDMILAGSPCQGFSVAGSRLAFDDPRSRLFFDFSDIIERYKKKNASMLFMLENVVMKEELRRIISDKLGCEPIMINSSLVSAQHRKRLYWTNIPKVTQPKDRDIMLKDIIFDDAVAVQLSNIYGGFKEKTPRIHTGKSVTIRTAKEGGHIPSLLLSKQALAYMNRKVKGGRNHWDFKHHSDVRNPKSAAVVANFFKGVPYNVLKDWNCIRKMHPIECERLQTLPDDYTFGVSNSQRYKMIGNGWTVEVIAHILKGVK